MRGFVLAAAVALAAATDIPAFYTRTADFGHRLKEATSKCGTLASIDTTTGLTVVNINTAAANKDHVPVRGVILFGEHARELVSPELGLKLITDICNAAHMAQNQQVHSPPRFAGVYTEGGVSASAYHAALADLVVARAFSLKIFPLVNPWGRKDVESGHACRRTNSHDVDLNRNYDAHWHGIPLGADGSIPAELADSYPGPSPFSEQETSVVRSVLDEFRPHFFLSVHSGTVGMYTPPAYTKHSHSADSEEGKRERTMAAMLARVLSQEGVGTSSIGGADGASGAPRFQQGGGLADLTFTSTLSRTLASGLSSDSHRVPVGPAGREVGYECPGTCLDYAYENVHAPFAFAFEIYQQPVPTHAFRQRGLDGEGSHGHGGHAHGHNHMAPVAAGHAASAAAAVHASANALNVDPLEQQLQAARRTIAGLPRFRSLRSSAGTGDDASREGGESEGAGEEQEELHPVMLSSCFGGRRSIIMPEHEERERALVHAHRHAHGAGSSVLLQTQEGAGRAPRTSRATTVGSHGAQQGALAAGAATSKISQAAAHAQGQGSAGSLHHVESAAGGAATMMSAEQCLGYFNPLTKQELDATLHKWALRTTRLMQLVHEQVMADHGQGQGTGQGTA